MSISLVVISVVDLGEEESSAIENVGNNIVSKDVDVYFIAEHPPSLSKCLDDKLLKAGYHKHSGDPNIGSYYIKRLPVSTIIYYRLESSGVASIFHRSNNGLLSASVAILHTQGRRVRLVNINIPTEISNINRKEEHEILMEELEHRENLPTVIAGNFMGFYDTTLEQVIHPLHILGAR